MRLTTSEKIHCQNKIEQGGPDILQIAVNKNEISK